MIPYDSYRLYQLERAKSPAEIRHADEQAARLAAVASLLFRGVTGAIMRSMREPASAASQPHRQPSSGAIPWPDGSSVR
jgi:hypothetical protein